MRLNASNERWRGVAVVTLLTVFAIAVAGYHPFAEDGGVYVAGIRKLLDPSLYPSWTAFVTEHLRFSLFAPVVAGLVRLTHLRLDEVLLALYCGSVWATLWGGWMLAARVSDNMQARIGAAALLACWLTLPIAGTSLMLMDPYVTARSFTTPLVLAALAWALDRTLRGWLLAAGALAIAALLHPLMAGYGVAAAVTLGCVGLRSEFARRTSEFSLMVVALAAAAVIQAHAPAETLNYLRVALTRYYWFPAEWHWYEWLGLAAPLALLAWLRSVRTQPAWQQTARAGIIFGLIATLLAITVCREGAPAHLVERLQPLRAFQIIYELMIVLLGAWLGERVLKAHPWRWAAMLALLGGTMCFAQREIYANSAHVEWPWAQPSNPWEQSFLWVRAHTPQDALFALDARYITQGRHEDAQCFRAIAERSALPDYSKDGGEASITPALTEPWITGQQAQTGLETERDTERLQKLQPLGVSWIVLEASSQTAWRCPYANATVKVCQMP
jgi:hypothetical protein